ncbi:MAG: aminotransferase class III-fold pyridoxal phosphate-dependent enzyme [Candidatus Calescibacterium sp.]|nr:aminotransferase class III-fold pyridoxal phosphate-dependent enzyme [Candidatus Calescibacterium sp.]MCX7971855.1 aminotransferase class III-fold pyridoxal phosphate-dependent enzyme [bacterium]MDW8195046.1 aminotransferase class III-fold pyridoxal phosphate-dependent enzyme [Candidatus Calescibacterium sp.]
MTIKVSQIPGPKVLEIAQQEKELLATSTKCWDTPAGPVEAKGIYFKDEDGNVLMDWTNGMVVILGHNHPQWNKAIIDQLSKFVYFNGPDFVYNVQKEAARILTEITPGKWKKKVFFCNSGTEANEAAIKIARISQKKNLIVGFIGAFHGRTQGSLSLTASKSVQRKGYTAYLNNSFSVPYPYCYRCWYNMTYPSCDLYCIRIIERYFQHNLPPDDIAAFIYEPVQCEGGYIVPPRESFKLLKSILDKYGILMIADEVQTGFGKSGYMFASSYFEVEPQIITLAKAISNGLPMGATVFEASLDFKEQGMHSNTFGGNALACRSLVEVYNIINQENLLERVRKLGDYFKNKLIELMNDSKVIGDVRVLGMLVGIEFVKDKKTKEPAREIRDFIIRKAYEKGLLLLSCGQSVIRITASYIITEEEIDQGIRIIREAVEEAEKRFL